MALLLKKFPKLVIENLYLFSCPNCAGEITLVRNRLICKRCKHQFNNVDGIPLLYWSNDWKGSIDVTDEVKKFYEKTPFPNYDDIDSIWSLRQKANESIYVRLLDEQLPKKIRILEAGCGTGQLSNILGIRKERQVFATDICLNSLRLGDNFNKKWKIEGSSFIQMNLFRPVFRKETFDLVISNGVLHHTSNPYLGFTTLAKLVKPGGYIIIGLYNRFGRKWTDLRRLLFKTTGDKFKFLDSYLRNKNLSKNKKRTWYKDQYENPHESEHTIDEVLTWFDKNNIEFINGIPKLDPLTSFSETEQLFKKNKRGTNFGHILVQLGLLLSGGSEGGFFTMIGRKR